MFDRVNAVFSDLWRIVTGGGVSGGGEGEHAIREPEKPDICPTSTPILWDYSIQYRSNIREGQQKPSPAFGSPTLVMHLGIWQQLQSDETFDGDRKKPAVEDKFTHFDKHNEAFLNEINGFIVFLQEHGRVLKVNPQENIEKFFFKEPEGLGGYGGKAANAGSNGTEKETHKFKRHRPQAIAFTLWWQDSDPNNTPLPNQRVAVPDFSAIRVRVQVQSNVDHVTLSFFIDVGKPYGEGQLYSVKETKQFIGHRRKRIVDSLDIIRAVSDKQIKKGFVERERLPEKGVDPTVAEKLLEAADYFYEGIWQDFMTSFGISVVSSPSGEKICSGKTRIEGECFADYRGLVMSMPGLKTKSSEDRKAAVQELRKRFEVEEETVNEREQNANIGIGRLNSFDFEVNEPNTLLKSLWPFLRRITPWADYKDFVGCGLIGGRVLFVSPLGAIGSFHDNDEGPGRASEIPSLFLPKDENTPLAQRTPRPVRYLVLTRDAPHREQLGRFVELVDTAASQRLFALKNLAVVKNAGTHIRLLGQELDGVLRLWGEERKFIEDWYNWEIFKVRHPTVAAEIEKKPGDVIVGYLAKHCPDRVFTTGGQSTIDDAKAVIGGYNAIYQEEDKSLCDILDSDPAKKRIFDVTIYHVFREYAEDAKANDKKREKSQGNVRQEVTDAVSDFLTGENSAFEIVVQLISQNQKQDIPTKAEQQLGEERAHRTSNLLRKVEQHLVEIGAALDNIGNGGSGRILYVINRAKYHASEFEKLVETMDIKNIDGWINYGRFVNRNVAPTLERIRSTGERLVSLRNRLQSVTEMIQTSALISETEATRTNTDTLRKISSNFYYAFLSVAVLSAYMTVDVFSPWLSENSLRVTKMLIIGTGVVAAALRGLRDWRKQS